MATQNKNVTLQTAKKNVTMPTTREVLGDDYVNVYKPGTTKVMSVPNTTTAQPSVSNPSVPPQDTQSQNQNGAETQAKNYNPNLNVQQQATAQPLNAWAVSNPIATGNKAIDANNQQRRQEWQDAVLNQSGGYSQYKDSANRLTVNDPYGLKSANSGTPVMSRDAWNKEHPITTQTQAQFVPQTPPVTTDIFKQYFADEEKEKKASKQRAMVGAIGDALRNIGNLYYTTQGATPQTIGTNAAAEENAKYQTEKANRQNLAYKYYTQKQANDIAKANAAIKNLLAQNTIATGESTRALNAVKAKQAEDDNKRKNDLHPYNVLDSVGKVAEREASAKLKGEQARKAKTEADLMPDKIKSEISKNEKTGNAALMSARASLTNASTNRTVAQHRIKVLDAQADNIKNGKDFEIPSKDPKKNYSIRKENASSLNKALAAYAATKKDQWSEVDPEASNSYITAAYAHLDDPGVINLLEKYSHGKTVSNIEDSDLKL